MLVVEDRTQRRLGLGKQSELHLGIGDGVKARGVEREVVAFRECPHALGDLHRLMGVARVVLEPREVVEDLDAQWDIVETVGQLERGAVALTGRVPRAGAHQDLSQPEDVIGAHPLGHGVVEQLDRRHGMLPRTRHITDEIEEHREEPVTARHHVTVATLGRPLVDLPDQLPARGVLALAAHHVRLDQLGTFPAGLVTQRAGPPLQRCRRGVCRVGI